MTQWINIPTKTDYWDRFDEVEIDYEFHNPNPDAGITMHAQGGDEMLRVAKDGFYVRGKKVEQDDKEAEIVYNAFKQWMAWAALTQQR
jgi:hypothetical protein